MAVKFTQNRHLPSFFLTKTTGAAHGEREFLSIIPLSSIFAPSSISLTHSLTHSHAALLLESSLFSSHAHFSRSLRAPIPTLFELFRDRLLSAQPQEKHTDDALANQAGDCCSGCRLEEFGPDSRE